MKYITPEQYDIAAKNGISQPLLYYRVYQAKKPWKIERAIEKPPNAKMYKYWQKRAEKNGIGRGAFESRIYVSGLSHKEAATKPLRKYRRKVQA